MKISVIVPCHNSSEYVNTCIDHLVNQTIGLSNMEIILVDDASTDDGKTMNILLEYENNYPDTIKVISLSENVKQGGARNIGITYSEGEYIAFCDSDDFLCFNALEILYEYAHKYDADTVEFDLFGVYTSDEINHYYDYIHPKPDYCKYNEISTIDDRRNNIFREDSSLGHPSKLYKGSLIREHNISFKSGVAFEEPAFTMMVRFLETKYVRIHANLYYVFIHQNITVQSDYEPKKFDNALTHDYLYNNLVKKGFYEQYGSEIRYLFWYWYYLNSLLFAVHRNCFFNEEELLCLQNRVKEVEPNIGDNPYFKKYWGILPELASITYCNIHEIGIQTLKEVFTKVNDLCN